MKRSENNVWTCMGIAFAVAVLGASSIVFAYTYHQDIGTLLVSVMFAVIAPVIVLAMLFAIIKAIVSLRQGDN